MAETIIKIDGLTKRYKELIAVDNLSFEIKKGEITGLLGPNGSGKTTTLSCILSLLNYDKGNIKIMGKKMTDASYDIKRKIGVVLQNVAVFDQLTVYENIDYFCGLYITDKKLRKKYVKEAIEFANLEEFKKFYPKQLSGGLLRRLNIACGIAHKPEIIIFDEPTVAVDPQSRNKILEEIIELNKKGATIIYTSHYMEEVEMLCSHIIIMDKGKKIVEGTSEELKKLIKNTETIKIELADIKENVIDEIKQLNHVYSAVFEENTLSVYCSGGTHNVINVLKILQNNDTAFGRIYTELPTLNDVFLEITGKELRDKEE